jgi:hypothetical protein
LLGCFEQSPSDRARVAGVEFYLQLLQVQLDDSSAGLDAYFAESLDPLEAPNSEGLCTWSDAQLALLSSLVEQFFLPPGE